MSRQLQVRFHLQCLAAKFQRQRPLNLAFHAAGIFRAVFTVQSQTLAH